MIKLHEKNLTHVLPPTNATVDIINNHVLDVLFQTHIPLTIVTNGLQSQMPVYCHTTAIIMEKRYIIPFAAIIRHSLNIKSYFAPHFYLFTCNRETTCNMINTLHGYHFYKIA